MLGVVVHITASCGARESALTVDLSCFCFRVHRQALPLRWIVVLAVAMALVLLQLLDGKRAEYALRKLATRISKWNS